MSKINIAVLFGGQSSEHEISCLSVVTVAGHIDPEKYQVFLVGITKEGRWLKVDSLADIQSGAWRESRIHAILSPDAAMRGILFLDGANTTFQKIDVVFPVLHGLYGEDGTVQGLLELSQIPYVGCGVLASAVSMDKFYTKIIVNSLGIRQAEYVPVLRRELSDMSAVVERVEQRFSYPVFVKPSNAGSSKGVSKAVDRESLQEALQIAAAEDAKILVEEMIVGRELECAVFGGKETKASGIGEILAAAEFYDYDAKYHSAESRTVVDPELPEGVAEEIRQDAARIFEAVDGLGLSRVDFFLEKGTNEVVFNEINTMPGFTSISMYPMLWGARGLAVPELVEELIQTAFLRRS
ncbi:D-alanine--D-alanine ligase family protein [Hominifimenecus sp. rT4P-3]|uniref:D-alanine--D-alanine ligase family protein n=1 Tax=Hominifimenecus sp. rT4P-3 TaxID=3242979 RepID=UPI003DA35482